MHAHLIIKNPLPYMRLMSQPRQCQTVHAIATAVVLHAIPTQWYMEAKLVLLLSMRMSFCNVVLPAAHPW